MLLYHTLRRLSTAKCESFVKSGKFCVLRYGGVCCNSAQTVFRTARVATLPLIGKVSVKHPDFFKILLAFSFIPAIIIIIPTL